MPSTTSCSAPAPSGWPVQIDALESSSTRYGHPNRCGAPAKHYAEIRDELDAAA